MTKNEFRDWCDRYGIYHYINALGRKTFGFSIKEGFAIDNYFLINNLEEFKATGKIDDYFHETTGKWVVFIHEN